MQIRRQEFVDLGAQRSLALAHIPSADQKLIRQDPVLSSLLRDDVIRGSDFGKLYDRLQQLDRSDPIRAPGRSISRAEKIYSLAARDTETAQKGYAPARTRQGIFAIPRAAPLDAGKLASAETQKAKAFEAAERPPLLGDGGAGWAMSQAASGFLEAGAKMVTGKDGRDRIVDGHRTLLEIDRAEQIVAEAARRDVSVRPTLGPNDQGPPRALEAKAKLHTRLADQLMKKGDFINASRYYDKAAEETASSQQIFGVSTQPEAEHELSVLRMKAKGATGLAYPSTLSTSDALLGEAVKAELEAFDVKTLEIDAKNLVLTRDTPAMAAIRKYRQAHDDETLDPKLREAIARHAVARLQREIRIVEADPTLSSAQKAAYLARAASQLPQSEAREIHATATRAFAKIAANSHDPKIAIAATRAALFESGAHDLEPTTRAELLSAVKNLSQLAKKSVGEVRGRLELEEGRIHAHLASDTSDPKVKKELHVRAGDAANRAAQNSGVRSIERAQALQLRATTERHLGNTANAKILGLEAARAFEAAAAAAQTLPEASDTWTKAAGEYTKIGRDADAQRCSRQSREESNLATQTVMNALKPTASKLDRTKEVTAAQVAELDRTLSARGVQEAAIVAKMKGDTAQVAFLEGTARRIGAMHELQAHLPAGAERIASPPTLKNLENYAKQSRAEFVAKFMAANNGAQPSEQQIAATVGKKLSRIIGSYYVHQEARGGLIDHQKSSTAGAGIDGRMMIDCVPFTYELSVAMKAAGFKVQSAVASRDGGFGPGHAMLEVQSQNGARLGYFNNGEYNAYTFASSANFEMNKGFNRTIGKDPPYEVKMSDPETDPVRKTGVSR